MTTGERPMRADARRNYDRLVNAGREAFTRHGTDAPMDDIARRAGVGPGTLYRHFPTRQALLAAVYRSDVETLVEQAREATRDRTPEEAVASWLRLLLEYTKQKHGLGSAIKTMLADDVETFAYCRVTMRSALGETLAAARDAGVLRSDASTEDVLRLVHGLGTALASAPEDAERLLGFVLDGLRPPAERPAPERPPERPT